MTAAVRMTAAAPAAVAEAFDELEVRFRQGEKFWHSLNDPARRHLVIRKSDVLNWLRFRGRCRAAPAGKALLPKLSTRPYCSAECVTGKVISRKSSYNSAKDVPHFCKWGLGLITGGEHISRLVEMPQRKVCLWQTLIEGIIIPLHFLFFIE